MSAARLGCGGCVLSDGRFAVFGWKRAMGATAGNAQSAVWVCL
jgi:hypothetical protein